LKKGSMIKTFSFNSVGEFLAHAQAALEANEAAHSLILGVCLRFRDQPAQATSRVCLKTIEDEGGLALAAMLTPPHNLSISGRPVNLDCSLGLLVSELAGEGWPIPGVLAPSPIARTFAENWAKKSQGSFQLAAQLNLLDLRQVPRPRPPVPVGQSRLRLAGEQDLALIARWFYGFTLEIFKSADDAEMRQMAEQRLRDKDVFVWEDGGQVVSMAMKNRPTRRSICVSHVYTPPELRGKGYATACVAELSRQLLQSGWEFCTLFVDVANLPACRAYQKIGYSLVSEYEEYRFPPL
jgi:predicted GNAT family acetyltransferase